MQLSRGTVVSLICIIQSLRLTGRVYRPERVSVGSPSSKKENYLANPANKQALCSEAKT